MSTGLLFFLISISTPVLWFLFTYNRFVRRRMKCRRAFEKIELQLKRRHDLTTGVIELVRPHVGHQGAVIQAVTSVQKSAYQARVLVVRDLSRGTYMTQLAASERALMRAIQSLLALAAKYPELKANKRLSEFDEAIASTEYFVTSARRLFNDAVDEYNDALEQFPAGKVASLCGLRSAARLQGTWGVDEGETEARVL